MALQDVLTKLSGNGLRSAGTEKWMARCPAHDDRNASLTISRGNKADCILYCHAGCKTEDIVAALGLRMPDLDRHREQVQSPPESEWPVTATYTYEDVNGYPLYRVLRKTCPVSGRKTFRQERYDGRHWMPGMNGVQRVLYHLPEVLDTAHDVPVFVVEGEKDVHTLAALGLLATTNAGGAGPGKWLPQYSEALRGRRVVILPDNDDVGRAHAEAVRQSLEAVDCAVTVVRLPVTAKGADVSDWVAAGGTKEQLLALSTPSHTFLPSPERLTGERLERIQMGQNALSFGVRYLDHALGGIVPKDVVLLGARTGAGKTEMSTGIALHNCEAGKRVHVFSLEAEDKELERRMKFRIVARLYYMDHTVRHRPIRYLDWYMGRLDAVLGKYEDVADMEYRRVARNLRTFYRVADDFTGDDFADHLERLRGKTDLVILDHLHYVDYDDEDENRGYKRIVKTVRDSALRTGTPIILIAHVRKGDRRMEQLVPSIEDFHGTSDIPKIATKAVMLAPAYAVKAPEKYLWPTYMQVAKCRLDGSVCRYAAILTFDSRTGGYEDGYVLGKLTEGGRTFTHLTGDEMPAWANSAGYSE